MAKIRLIGCLASEPPIMAKFLIGFTTLVEFSGKTLKNSIKVMETEILTFNQICGKNFEIMPSFGGPSSLLTRRLLAKISLVERDSQKFYANGSCISSVAHKI